MILLHRVACEVKAGGQPVGPVILEAATQRVIREAIDHGWHYDNPAERQWPLMKLDSESQDVTVFLEWPVSVQ
jgi:hypothetical protein